MSRRNGSGCIDIGNYERSESVSIFSIPMWRVKQGEKATEVYPDGHLVPLQLTKQICFR